MGDGAMKIHTLEIENGHDVFECVMAYTRRMQRRTFVLSGSGGLTHPSGEAGEGDVVIHYGGRFTIASLNGSFATPENFLWDNSLDLAIEGRQVGHAFGGTVVGPLVADGLVVVDIIFYTPTYERLPISFLEDWLDYWRSRLSEQDMRSDSSEPSGEMTRPYSAGEIYQFLKAWDLYEKMDYYTLKISSGCDVFECMAEYARRRQRGIWVKGGIGTVKNVSLSHLSGEAAEKGDVVNHYVGCFTIVSLNGLFFPITDDPSRYNSLSIYITGAQLGGRAIEGSVISPLIADGPVFVTAFPDDLGSALEEEKANTTSTDDGIRGDSIKKTNSPPEEVEEIEVDNGFDVIELLVAYARERRCGLRVLRARGFVTEVHLLNDGPYTFRGGPFKISSMTGSLFSSATNLRISLTWGLENRYEASVVSPLVAYGLVLVEATRRHP